MKTAIASLILLLSASSNVFAQSSGMQGMDPKSAIEAHKCMDMKAMKGMDMTGMDAEKCKAMMAAHAGPSAGKGASIVTHKAIGVVQKVDRESGMVTLAHGAVKSLNWPAMTMGFSVKQKSLFDKLTVGRKVSVEFVQQGNQYVVTAVK